LTASQGRDGEVVSRAAVAAAMAREDGDTRAAALCKRPWWNRLGGGGRLAAWLTVQCVALHRHHCRCVENQLDG